MPRPTRRTWALAINGGAARILRTLAPAPDAPPEIVLHHEPHRLRDVMADQPGRSFASIGDGRRGAVAFSGDPLEEEQRRFVREVARLLETHRRAGDFDDLVVVAGDEMLGRLRRDLPEALRGRVVAEVPRNLLHLSAAELPRAIAGHLAERR